MIELRSIGTMDSVLMSEYKKTLIALLKVNNYSEDDYKSISNKINAIDRKLGLSNE